MKHDYKEVNKAAWNERTKHHIKSNFYDVPGFINGKNTLNDIELSVLGDLKDKSVLHLQCHFGQDTISFARLGAKATGVDLSDESISEARELNEKCGTDCTFVCSDILGLKNNLSGQFDIVFTSYGTIGWLPDINQWADIVSHFLKPGGQFVIADFHPVVWMYNDDFSKIAFDYFNSDPIVEEISGSYTDGPEDFKTKMISWNHAMSEIISALLNKGLQIDSFNEFDYSPYDCFPNMTKIEERKYQLNAFDKRVPMVYLISAHKPIN